MMWLDTDELMGKLSVLQDDDGDTKIQCEESADEDIIRMDVAGVEKFKLTNNAELLHAGAHSFRLNDTTAGGIWTLDNGQEEAGAFSITKSGAWRGFIISPDGEVTKPKQPAFRIENQAETNMTTDYTIRFSNEAFDQGNDFNVSTYTFTAPVDGKYQLSIALQLTEVDNAYTHMRVLILTSNEIYYSCTTDPAAESWGGDPTYFGMNMSVLADMDANDTAYVFFQKGGGANQVDITANSAYFTGALIC